MTEKQNQRIKPLTNKVAIVTGGSGFLGRQHCLALVEHGATVYNFDLNQIETDSIETENYTNGQIKFIACDISKELDVGKAVEKVLQNAKKIDVLINNASIDHKVTENLAENRSDYRFENFDFSSWEKEIGVGLNGAIYCSKYVSKNMIVNKSGSIINIASDLGVIAPDQRIYLKEKQGLETMRFYKPFSYSVIKHGLVGLTKYLSTYLAEYGIRVNTLSPGSIENHQDVEFLNSLRNRIPMGRLANVEEYKGAIQFLASDASSYMTGQNLIIDGGRSTW
jgi:NAD(P)-dependent dehydrogenase (short-subunit alcohol dehydrogenase family)